MLLVVIFIVNMADVATPFDPVALILIENCPVVFGMLTVTPELLLPDSVDPAGAPSTICHVTVPVFVALCDMLNEYAPD